MSTCTRMLLVAALLLVPASSLRAQTAVDPSGHWEGTLQAPNMEVKVEIDLAKNSKGELEGTWNGTLDVNGGQMRLIVKMSNQPDGTATGTIVSPDGSGVEIPIAMTQKASSLTIDVTSVGGSYVGVLNATGTELAGMWTQGGSTLPLTFRLARP